MISKIFLLCSTTIKKKKLSGSERNKRWRAKKGADFHRSESERVEKRRKSRVSQMSARDLQKYRMAAAERKRKSRMSKNRKEMESVQSQSDSTSPSTSSQPFKRPQSLGKAIKRSIRALPQSPRKRKAVVSGLARRFAVDIKDKLETSMSRNSLSNELQDLVTSYYFRPDVSYTMPGLKDEMTVWKNGKKERLRKHYLTMFLREAFAVFKELHPTVSLGFSTFCRLRPANVLLLKNTPKDQCKCKIHENFRMKLDVLDSTLTRQDCWKSILCSDTSDLQSDCWMGKCDACKDGKLLANRLSSQDDMMAKEIEWLEGENNENDVLKKHTKTGCYAELLELTIETLPEAQEHTRIKRIQSDAFEMLKETNRILQIDFAMAYSCEYQDEVQSALWSRASVTLFTAAVFYKGTTKTYLICSDTKDKGKDTVYTFINRLYEHIVKDVPISDGTGGDIIFSDGPSSEFKNKYCMRMLYDLGQKFQKDFSWKYFATSHGKGVVDGVGGRAKSLVRQKSMSKDGHDVVQSSKDFAKLASELMSATTVMHIDQEEIDEAVAQADPWDDAPAAVGIRSMHDAQFIFSKKIIELRHVTGQMEPDSIVYYDATQTPIEDTITPQAQVSAINVASGDWVAVIYDDQWWPGSVDAVSSNNQISISFMKPVAENKFIWRQSPNGECLDTDIVPIGEVLVKLEEIPEPVSNRHFSFSSSYAKRLTNLMKSV